MECEDAKLPRCVLPPPDRNSMAKLSAAKKQGAVNNLPAAARASFGITPSSAAQSAEHEAARRFLSTESEHVIYKKAKMFYKIWRKCV